MKSWAFVNNWGHIPRLPPKSGTTVGKQLIQGFWLGVHLASSHNNWNTNPLCLTLLVSLSPSAFHWFPDLHRISFKYGNRRSLIWSD